MQKEPFGGQGLIPICLLDPSTSQGHPTRFPGKYLLLNQLIPGRLAKLNKCKILAG